MNTLLSRLECGLLAALDNQTDASGRLFDPVDDTLTPVDHYGQCAAALATACDAQTPERFGQALRYVEEWARAPTKLTGHDPFNRLLLRLLQRVLRDHREDHEGLTRLDRLALRCTLAKSYPSNNWTLLAQLVRLIEAPKGKTDQASAIFCAMLDRWTTPEGGFIDYPARPKAGSRVATPIAYHHKALLLTALASRLHPHPALFAHLRRLYDWLVHCWDPNGYAGGIGRSSHALFGDGCLIGAMSLLGQDHDNSECMNALVRRLEHQLRDDGLLWLDPFGHDEGKANWDIYMHLSVYNAWFAAMVGACRWLGSIESDLLADHDIEWRGTTPGIFHDEQAGILFARQPEGMNILFSTRGQLPQAANPDVADLRYAGGLPMHATDTAGNLVIRPPARHARALLVGTPALAEPIWVILRGDELYGLTDFDNINVRVTGKTLTITLRGSPVALTRPLANGFVPRVIAAIDWRFMDGRIGRWQALHRSRLAEISAELEWELALDHPSFGKHLRTTTD